MAESIRGINVVIGADTTGLGKALSEVNKQSRNIQSELKQVNRGLKFDPSSTTLLAQKQELLGKSIDITKQKLKQLESVQDQVNKQFANGEISEGQYRAFQREIDITQSKLKNLEGQLKSTGPELQSFGEKANAASQKLNSIGKTAGDLGKSMTLGLTVPIAGAAAAAVKVGNDFETSMSQAAGALNKPMAQMGSLRDLALKTGQETQFSATEAGNAITELAKGGLTEAQIKGGSLKATMDLAAASSMDLGTSANTVVQAMGAFGLSATQSTQAVNALAGAAAASSTDVEPLTEGLAQCAAQAHLVGWSIQDTTAVLGEFADAGVVGSDAGTSLKTMLQRLGAPTDTAAAKMAELGINVWDGSGHMKNAAGIAQELQSKMSGLSDAQKQAAMNTIFGSDATRAASILMNNGAKGLSKYTKATNDQSSASRLAASQMGDTSKAIEQMFGALETAAIKVQEALAPAITAIANFVGNLATAFSNLSPVAQTVILVIAGITAALGPLLLILGGAFTIIGTVAGAIGVITTGAAAATPAIAGLVAVIKGIGLVFTAITSPIGIAVMAIAAAAILIKTYWTPITTFFSGLWEGIKQVFSSFWTWLQSFFAQWGTVILAIIAPFIGIPLLIYQNWSTITATLSAVWTSISTTAMTIFTSIATFFSTIWTTIQTVFSTAIAAISSFITTNFSGAITGIQTIFSGLASFFTGIWEIIKNVFLGAILLILDLVTGNFTQLSADTQLIWNNLKDAFSAIWESIKAIFSGAVQAIATVLSAAWNGMKTVVTTVWNGIKSFLSSLWSGLVSLASSAFNSMKSAISSIVTSTINTIQSIWNGILNFFRSLPGTLASLGSAMFNAMKNAISSVLSTLGGVVRAGFSSAISYIKSLPSQFFQWGKDMIQGLINGIRSMFGAVGDAVTWVADKIRSLLHHSTPDEGPLKDDDTWFPDMMKNFADGINNNSNKVISAMDNIVKGIADKVSIIKDVFEGMVTNVNSWLGDFSEALKSGLNDASFYINNSAIKLGTTLADAVMPERNARSKYFSDYGNGVITADRAVTELDGSISQLQTSTGDYKTDLRNLLGVMTDQSTEINILTSEYNKLAAQYGANSDKAIEALKKVQDLRDAYQKTGKDIQDLTEKFKDTEIDNVNDVNDKIKDALKQRYEDEKDAAEKQVKLATDTQTKLLQAKIDAISDQESSLDNQYADEDDADKEAELRRQLSMHWGAEKRQELQDELDDLIKTRDRRHQKEQLDQQKQSLQDQIDAIKDQQDQTLSSLDDFYDQKLSDANLEAEAEKTLMNSSQQELVALLHNYGEDYKLAGQDLGTRLVEGFQGPLTQLQAMFDNLKAAISEVQNSGIVPTSASLQSAAGSLNLAAAATSGVQSINLEASQPATIVTNTYLDSKQVAKTITPYVSKIQGKNLVLDKRGI